MEGIPFQTKGAGELPLLGIYEGEDLVYVGRAGTGISESDRRCLKQLMDAKARSPIQQAPKPRPKERITWLERVVAELNLPNGPRRTTKASQF